MADTESVNQANGTATATQERTFTQSELNDILQSRLNKEREKYSDYEALKEKASKFDQAEEASKTELQKATEKAQALQSKIDAMTKEAEISAIRTKVASDTGVPINLLSGDTEESCIEQAKGILAFAKPNAYPTVKDGGEITPPSSKNTRDLFSDFVKNNLQK